MLKIAGAYEIETYEKYVTSEKYSVPEYYGTYRSEEKDYILVSFLEGTDLSSFNSQIAKKAAKEIARIHNDFFTEDRTHYRYQRYLERIEKRSKSLENEPVLAKAYDFFLRRQREIPLTFCHGDYLPLNALWSHENVYIIDWGFSGFMPYALDVARMIAHGLEKPTEETFPFTMVEEDKEIFLKQYYYLAHLNLSYEEYRRDVKLAMLNEYIEFVERELLAKEKVENNIYYIWAKKTAEEIL